jgi:AbiV family abortive infection protein
VNALTREQLEEGRRKALENARELVDEAGLLHANAYWPRVVFLCHIAAEELGKYIMLVSAFVELTADPHDFDWSRFWKRFTSHKQKFTTLSFWEEIRLAPNEPATGLEPGEDYFANLGRTVNWLEAAKQKSLYADFFKRSFRTPRDLIGEGTASRALELSQKRVQMMALFEKDNSHKFPLLTRESVVAWRSQCGLAGIWESRPLRTKASKTKTARQSSPARGGS